MRPGGFYKQFAAERSGCATIEDRDRALLCTAMLMTDGEPCHAFAPGDHWHGAGGSSYDESCGWKAFRYAYSMMVH